MKKYSISLLTATVSLLVFSSSAQNTWIQKGDVGTAGRKNAVAFSIGTKGYITTGLDGSSSMLNDLWEYDQGAGTWTQKANFSGTPRWSAVGFSVGNFGYVGSGNDAGGVQSSFYKYDPSGNSWTSITSMPGLARRSACAFATSTKGYVGLGLNGSTPLQNFYEYDPGTGMWTAIASFPGTARYLAAAAAVNGKGYVGTGLSGGTNYYQDWYEYDPTGNSWSSKLDFTGGLRAEAMAFGVAGKIYLGTGYNNNSVQKIDCWEFDPTGNTWVQRADVALNTYRRNGAVGFAIGSYGYCAAGTGQNGVMKDTYEYTPLSVGLENEVLKNKVVNVYPNPCNGSMTLEYELLKNVPATFILMDAAGKEVSRYNLPSSAKSLKISEPSLEEGVYFYRLSVQDNWITSGKILVVR